MTFKVRVKLPSRPPTAGEGGGGELPPRPPGGRPSAPPAVDPVPTVPIPMASAPVSTSTLSPAGIAAAHARGLVASPLLAPPPPDPQARWVAVLAGVRGLAGAAGDGCLVEVAGSLVAQAYERRAAAAATTTDAAAADAPPLPDRVLLDDVLAVAVVSLPPACLRAELFKPLAEAVGGGRVAYGRRAPPFHALVSACGGAGGAGGDGGGAGSSDEEEGAGTAADALDDGPAAVLGAIADAAARAGTSAAGRSSLAAWAADTLVACPAGASRNRRMAGLVRASPALAAAAAGRHAAALQPPAAWAALGAGGGGGESGEGVHPALAPCVACLASAGSPEDVARGVRAALRCASPARRLASFVDAVVCSSGGGGGPPGASARVGAALGALATAMPASTTAAAALEALLSRPGLEAALDPADAVGGGLMQGGHAPLALLAAAWARAAAAWLGRQGASSSVDGDAMAATARAIWLAQCAAVVGGGHAGNPPASSSFTPILAAGLGAAGAALPLPAATAVATALLTRATGVSPALAVQAVRALADGVGPERGPGLLAAAGAAAVRVAAAGALVEGRRSEGCERVLDAGCAVMGEGIITQRPDVARALAVLAAIER